jgi:hypothetical protein
MKRTFIVVILLCGLALPGCDDDAAPLEASPATDSVETPASPSPNIEPSPTSSGASGCENEREATKPKNLRRGSLTGDLDGDGSDEVVRLAVDQAGPQGCRAFVVVGSSSIEDVTAIDDPNMSFDLGLPALDSIRPIGFGPGDELILVLSAGASTQFFGMASVADGDLTQVTIEEGAYGNLFPYGGSAGHIEASDCASPEEDVDFPTLVISSATSEGNRYRLERRFFEIEDGTELVPVPGLTVRQVVSFNELVSFPEFGEAPFAHCG